jgi:predicted  nucleic acid-binding Zn-ribbon protein
VQARIIALEREIETLKNENCNLQSDAKSQLLLNSQEWRQKLNDSEERSSASLRELQDQCKNLENSNENLKREMEEALEEAWAEAGLGKKASATHGLLFSFFGSMACRPQSSGCSKKCEKSVKDSVKSAVKDELARVKAELTASQNKVDELKEVMQQQQNVCDDARETAQTEMQAKLIAKDAEVNLPHTNAQRLEAELASKPDDPQREHPRLAKKESFEAHLARGVENNDVVTAPGLQRASAYIEPRVCNIEQESELREIRVKLSAQEKLFEACERKLQEALQLVASRNTATI